MAEPTILELRLEAYGDGGLAPPLESGITALLERWWPEMWDVKRPPTPSREHPAEWHATIPLPEGETPESIHGRIESEVLALDPSRSIRFRTRWSFPESPNHQEVYEVRWDPDRP
ncbi:MAG TPA: hypothetical protein VMF04_01005 [Thermoplasmata archaeon]|nr:hypothetical protein [Thermoplasmata archaeon]